jgi:hypothetical protein
MGGFRGGRLRTAVHTVPGSRSTPWSAGIVGAAAANGRDALVMPLLIPAVVSPVLVLLLPALVAPVLQAASVVLSFGAALAQPP